MSGKQENGRGRLLRVSQVFKTLDAGQLARVSGGVGHLAETELSARGNNNPNNQAKGFLFAD